MCECMSVCVSVQEMSWINGGGLESDHSGDTPQFLYRLPAKCVMFIPFPPLSL